MANGSIVDIDPTTLSAVRRMAHFAVQWPSRAARANIEARQDDSHSNLGWDRRLFGLVSHGMGADGQHQLGFSFADHTLNWISGGQVREKLDIEGIEDGDVQNWCDGLLATAGLQPTSNAEMPYDLGDADYSGFANKEMGLALNTLGCWYDLAQGEIEGLVKKFGADATTTPAIRCWPHHFDLATLFVLGEGDPETGDSIGVGLSPGDGSFDEPYFYCSPWPVPKVLPTFTGEGFQWHTAGFTSLVCKASELGSLDSFDQRLVRAYETVHKSVFHTRE